MAFTRPSTSASTWISCKSTTTNSSASGSGNKANNINGVDGDLNGNGQGPEIHTLNAPKAILELQQAYVRRVMDTLNDLDNVLYKIGNEMHTGSVQWQYRMIDFIHASEKQKPRQHPVGMTGAPMSHTSPTRNRDPNNKDLAVNLRSSHSQ